MLHFFFQAHSYPKIWGNVLEFSKNYFFEHLEIVLPVGFFSGSRGHVPDTNASRRA